MDYRFIFKFISENSEYGGGLLKILEKELSLPNIPLKTNGGEKFWITISEYNGWKLQKNMITQHARILNEKNIRIAWGTYNGMKKAMDRLSEEIDNIIAKDDSIKLMEELEKLNELLREGIIEKDEYNKIKAKIMKKLYSD